MLKMQLQSKTNGDLAAGFTGTEMHGCSAWFQI
jgi:hypothetical protein